MNSHQETLNDLARILDNYAQEIHEQRRLLADARRQLNARDAKETSVAALRADNRDLRSRLDVVREQREEMDNELEAQKQEYEYRLQELWVKVESLRATNAALRAENATLRRMRDEACEAILDAGPVVDEGERQD